MEMFTLIFYLHFLFLISVFDIYFAPTVIDNIKFVKNTISDSSNFTTNTKRLVLIVGDGLPAEHIFDLSSGYSRAPFLR